MSCVQKPNLTVNHKLKFDPVVEELIVSGEVNFRRHPGIVNVKQVEVPVRLQKAILALAEREHCCSSSKTNAYRSIDTLCNTNLDYQGCLSRHCSD